ncbi:MAG: hypothetical protein BGN88_04915 [Clostridiales bacterium 43-6]|nr:MAG: hypothetical protein BGN88_04915 [Clostridiales bacterium 43-6]
MKLKKISSFTLVICLMFITMATAHAAVTRNYLQYNTWTQKTSTNTGWLEKPSAATWKYGEDDNVSCSTNTYYNMFRSRNTLNAEINIPGKHLMYNGGYISVSLNTDDNFLGLRLYPGTVGIRSTLLGRLFGSYQAW